MLQKKENKIDNYKLALILKYFDEVGEGYSYNEMMGIFGYSFKQLQQQLDYIEECELLKFNNFYIITEEAKTLLNKYNLNEISLNEFDLDFDEDNIFTEEPIGLDEIYIPSDFDKKFELF